jgi:hypothetical protein
MRSGQGARMVDGCNVAGWARGRGVLLDGLISGPQVFSEDQGWPEFHLSSINDVQIILTGCKCSGNMRVEIRNVLQFCCGCLAAKSVLPAIPVLSA